MPVPGMNVMPYFISQVAMAFCSERKNEKSHGLPISLFIEIRHCLAFIGSPERVPTLVLDLGKLNRGMCGGSGEDCAPGRNAEWERDVSDINADVADEGTRADECCMRG